MRVFAISLLTVLIFMAAPAMAQDGAPPIAAAADAAVEDDLLEDQYQGIVTECGAPTHTDIDTTKVLNECDMYTRQLGYYDEQKNLKNQLLERQKNFYAPHKEARDNYKKGLEAHWASMGAAKTGGND
jgi:hypothetical protein